MLCCGIQTIAMKQKIPDYPSGLIDCIKFYKNDKDVQPYGENYSRFTHYVSQLRLNTENLHQLNLKIKEAKTTSVNPEKLDIPLEFFKRQLIPFKTYHGGKVSGNICFNSCQKKVAFIKDYKELVIVDFNKNKPLERAISLEAETLMGSSRNEIIDFNDDESVIACAVGKTIFFYNTHDLKKIDEIVTAQENSKIKFSPNGKSFVVQSKPFSKNGGYITVYEFPLLNVVQSISTLTNNFNVDSKGEHIIINDQANKILLYNLKDQKKSTVLSLQKNVSSCNFVNDDKEYLCIGPKNTFLINPSKESKPLISYEIDLKQSSYDPIQHVIADISGNKLAIKDCGNLYNTIDSICGHVHGGSAQIDSVHVSRDGNYMAIEKKTSSTSFSLIGNKSSIEVYNIPLFECTAKKLTPEQRNFAFFCDYWQQRDEPMPYQYRASYDDLPDNLKTKFKSIFVKGEQEEEQRYKWTRYEQRRKDWQSTKTKAQEVVPSQQRTQEQPVKSEDNQSPIKNEKAVEPQPSLGFTQKFFNAIKSYIIPSVAVSGLSYFIYKYFNPSKE